jgi:hypothetical protein
MKKINFELIFKILVLVQLSTIIMILIFAKVSDESETLIEPNEIGRYKEIKTKEFNLRGEEIGETVRILDTKTGQYVQN